MLLRQMLDPTHYIEVVVICSGAAAGEGGKPREFVFRGHNLFLPLNVSVRRLTSMGGG
jgi:hypothetical protein